jgi:hypothetical protein
LVYAELNYAKYRDFDAKLQADDFISFIVNEAESMNGQKDHDLNECRSELSRLEGIIEHMNLDQQEIKDQIRNVQENKLKQSQTTIAKYEEQLSQAEAILADKDAQIAELKVLIQGMHEQKNKDIKGADKANLKEIEKQLVQLQSDTTIKYILDSICIFLTGSTDATFAKNGQEFFTDEKVYGESIRKCKPETLDKNFLREIANKINTDTDGKSGAIATAITQVDEPTKYINFFCHFKVLFKLVQIGLSVKKQEKLEKEKVTYQNDI